ncbi:hypothetical protein TWF569_005979 [Orbilia oligospora]|uniref:Uncharacterized protein n=1 Tax=Orbilia oligospora TaxID=2813651 RepID=A0A7C8NHM2_ORBOL|nr:hypothetical protein TWF102_004852 [Orbilia oligospora]KAF3104296.1 hypothetical protein TWF103_006959 [Orbilia oligospora]KAF3108278.1 hypothetical protein TWF706_002170 [Orbilia oligospora]KAF3147867.1 hypothetical protein TWF569_005979 [Orbilia oligospora]
MQPYAYELDSEEPSGGKNLNVNFEISKSEASTRSRARDTSSTPRSKEHQGQIGRSFVSVQSCFESLSSIHQPWLSVYNRNRRYPNALPSPRQVPGWSGLRT